ncbi:MAG: MMPL family transporter [Gammaproteobacteria bacterium]|nr:MMPL family transporter [Gammaproteobacteria bacterium]
MLLWRSLFGIALFFTAVFFIRSHDALTIDTDLKDLSPSLSEESGLRYALESLSNGLEKQFILLLVGHDVDQITTAHNFLIQNLAEINNVSLAGLDELQTAAMLEELKAYRFRLLTPEQRQSLTYSSVEKLAVEAQERLFRLGGSVTVLPFEQDPLAWFSDFTAYLLAAINPQQDQIREVSNESFDGQRYVQALTATIQHGALEIATQEVLSAQLLALEQEIKERYSVELYRSGVFFFTADAAKKSKREMSLIGASSLLGIFVLLIYVFRSLLVLMLPFLSIALGLGFALAATHSVFGAVHILTIVFGASLVGVVIDYSLHYFYHIGEERQLNKNRQLYRALLLSLVTSLVGFAALSFSGLAALTKLAVFACSGIAMAWLSVVCLAPLLLPSPIFYENKLLPRLLTIIQKPIAYVSQRLFLVAAAGVMCVCLVWLIFGENSNDDPRLFYKPPASILAQERLVSSIVSHYEPGRYLIIEGESVAQVYERFDRWRLLVGTDTVQSFATIMNWIPSPQTQAENFLLQNDLYKKQGVIEQMLSSLGTSNAIAKNLQHSYLQVSQDNLTPQVFLQYLPEPLNNLCVQYQQREYCFVLISKGSDMRLIRSASEQTIGVTFINTVAMAEQALKKQRVSASKLLLLAYVLIGFILLLRFRSMNSLLMLVVPGAATATTILILAILGQSLNLFHTMALFLILGLGMDYVIFSREMYASQRTLQAILLSAITTVFSFGLLAFSSVPVVQAFGLTLLIGNVLNFVFALIFAQHYSESFEGVYGNR